MMKKIVKNIWEAPLLLILNTNKTKGYTGAWEEDPGAETGSQLL